MMSREKICFMMEWVRHGLKRPGDLLEIGVWQGGSAWYTAQVLARLAPERRLFLVDVFESSPIHSSATMCTEEIRRALSFHKGTNVMVGRINDKDIMDVLVQNRYCFIHCDLGFQHAKPALATLWDHMPPGAVLLFDNYGHLHTQPAELEKFFDERGARTIRLPWSEQGVVIR
jgi:predicted O-methyltransferase YrrM